jgi:peptidyl-dipeptidase A
MRPLVPVVCCILAMLLPLFGCQRASDEEKLRAFITTRLEQLEPLMKSGAMAGWNSNATGEEKYYDEMAATGLRISTILSNPSDFAFLKALKEKGLVKDPLLQRQLIILFNSFARNQVDTAMLRVLTDKESAVAMAFNTNRGALDGVAKSDNELCQILSVERNQERRRAAWEALKEVGKKVAPMLIDLAKLRNQAARKVGFENYYVMMLSTDEQDPGEVLKVFDELATLTEAPFISTKRSLDAQRAKFFGIAPACLRPWHYEDPFFQEAPANRGVDLDLLVKGKDITSVVRAFYSGIGLPADDLLDRSDLAPRAGKYQHAYSIDIDRLGDIRTMCNLSDNIYSLVTILHELGHGVYTKNIDRSLPFLLRTWAHSFVSEAIAQLFEAQARDEEWLSAMIGLGKCDPAAIHTAGEAQQRMDGLIFSRWAQVMMRFERAFYENPHQDLNTVWWDLVEKYQRISRPEGRNEPDWAAKIHFALYPCYYHNYMLGRLATCQILNALNRKVRQQERTVEFSFAGLPEVGSYLKTNVFAHGTRLHWNDLLKQATGEGLTARYFAEQYCMETGQRSAATSQ